MRVYHPNADAVRDTVDDVDGAVTLGRETYSVADDDTLDVPEAEARTLARRYDVTLADIRAESDGDDAETCDEVKNDGEVCGRELPCPYHSDDGGE